MNEPVKCEVFFEDGNKEEFTAAYEGLTETQGGLEAVIRQESVSGCILTSLSLKKENSRLRAENPVRLTIPMEKQPLALTAMYMLNPWWTRPAFADSYAGIPEKTRTVFAKYSDCYACLFPMMGKDFMAMMAGGNDTGIVLGISAGTDMDCEIDEPVFLYAEGNTVNEAVHRVFEYLEERLGLLPRKERAIPEMYRYLGWCSWDAFYRDVNEEGIRAKAKELHEKNVPVRWMLVDDGWQPVSDRTMDAYEPDPAKFPHGFRQMTDDIRNHTQIRWFGVWHALFGYWDGVTPESPLWTEGNENLIRAADGKILPDPENAEGFYRKWYEQLADDGIDFTKVDGQSSLADLYKNTVPVTRAARGVCEGLEKASSVFHGAVINCMGMAMENILARRTLAVSRNSDDFVPARENGFAEHLLQNAYNSLYHNELYCCDWDMFWTRHPDAVRHALIRAVSGGPVYFSDRTGETDPEILHSLCYDNGELLMMSRSARPTDDCIFSDPLKSGVLKLQNAGMYAGKAAGGIAVFNLSGSRQDFSFSAADVPELADQDCIVYDYFKGTACGLGSSETFKASLEADGFAWYVLIPADEITCLGLTDKFAGFMAVRDICRKDGSFDFTMKGGGTVQFCSPSHILCVLMDGKDVTDSLLKADNLYSISLPEKGETKLSVSFS